MMEKELPKGWVETTIKSIANNIQYGYTAKSSQSIDGVKYLRITDIQNEKVIWENVPNCTITESELKKFILNLGDIVFARTGATVGKSFLIENLPFKSVFASYLIRLSVSKSIDVKLIKYFFYSSSYWNQISKSATGIGQPNVNATKLAALEFPLPPLPEQKRIVAKLDRLFASLAVLQEKLARIPQLLANFRQSVLTQAVTGKLTEDFNKWSPVKMKDVVTSIKAGKNFSCPSIPVQTGKVGLVKISAVTWGQFDEKETKTVERKDLINSELFIKKGDFLMSRANTIELVGSSVIVDKINYDIMLSDKVWRVNFSSKVLKRYVNYFLKSTTGRFEIESRASGNQVSMRNLSQKKFLDIDIKLPPLSSQTQIVTRVESLFAKATAIETRYQQLKTQVEQLPQAILAKAFRGELVAQLPTDGDARELLAEIAKLSEELKGKGKRRRK